MYKKRLVSVDSMSQNTLTYKFYFHADINIITEVKLSFSLESFGFMFGEILFGIM